jgi:hypothetical protein
MSNYTVPFSNPSKAVLTVADATINQNTSLKLIGKFVTNYSQPISENFVKLLENFSHSESPLNPIEGQLWYNTTNETSKSLRIYDGSSWVPTNNVHKVSGGIGSPPFVPSSASLGDLLVTRETGQLWIYNGGAPILVGPSTATTELRNGVYVEPIKDDTDTFHSVVNTYVDGDVICVYSKDRFTPSPVITGFSEIRPGLNVTTRSFSGEDSFVSGNSQVALSLKLTNISFPIPADNFLRNDEPGVIQGALSINSDAGIRIGTPNQSILLERVGSSGILSNRINEGDLGLSVFKNNLLHQVLTVDGGGLRVGIKNTNPAADLHVSGTSIFTEKITVGTLLSTGAIIEPAAYNAVDIGSIGKPFKNIFAETFNFTSTTTNYSHVATGGIIIHASTTPPDGWLACDGSIMNTTTNPEYAKLSNLLGSFVLPTLSSPGSGLIYIIKY